LVSEQALPRSFENASEPDRPSSGELPSPASLQTPETGAAAAEPIARRAGASTELAAAAERDRRLVALVHASYPFLWRTLRRVGVTEAQIDPVLEEVFLIAHRRLDGISEGGERVFLLSMALRAASTRCLAVRRRREHDSSADAAVNPPSAPERLPDPRRARALLDEILGGMSLKFRTVFVLFELEGLALSEIAKLLEISLETAASRVRRASEWFRREAARLEPSALGLKGRP
jgi:RNA polymerase sigma-70 factor (ECF subfamily)